MRWLSIDKLQDIPKKYRKTPIGRLLEYHNLNRPYDVYKNAQLLVGMCMDSRKHLHIPDNFSFILRTGGANMRHSEFRVSYAIGVGGVSHMALIGHTHCGMVNLEARKNIFIEGLVKRGGWERRAAEEHFAQFSLIHEIGDEVDFVLAESKRLRLRYPKIMIAPMIYRVEDNRLYLIKEN